jgi:RNA polymerase primary sigma factor
MFATPTAETRATMGHGASLGTGIFGGCKVVEPHVRPLTDRQLGALNEGDRALVERVLSEPVEYINHQLFGQASVEKILFGEKAALASGSNHFQDSPADPAPDQLHEGTSLNSAQEILLFQRFNYARLRISRVITKYQGKALSNDAIRELVGWAHRASLARSQIVQANIPLVLAMAKRTRLSSLDFNELISEGNFALLRSVDKFDCSRGFKFSTYACRAILKSFSRVALRTSRYRGRFPTEFDPTLEKSDYVDRKRDGVEADCVSEIREILTENRAELNDMERTVIRERFALTEDVDQPRPKTLEQVGELIGVTKERVRQIQNKALRKIRAILEDTYLTA